MRKQYRYEDIEEEIWSKYCLYIYHDSKLIHSQSLYPEELDEEIERLEAEGYTYGYTLEEVKEAKRLYEKSIENIIY